MTGASFGIGTPPQQVGNADVPRVWQEADTIPEIEHAWAFDHLFPIAGDRSGPIGGQASSTLRVVTEHADVWNVPGANLDDAIRRSALLDRLCAEIGRDRAAVTRSLILPGS